jgi:hypothetical protein
MTNVNKEIGSDIAKVEVNDDKLVDAENPGSEDEEKMLQLQKVAGEMTGMKNPRASLSLLAEIFSANYPEEKPNKLSSITGIMQALKPRDPLEAMLLGQMITLDNRGMERFQKSRKEIFTDKAESHERQGIRLFKAYASLLRAFIKYRSDCLQNLIINQVQVNKGGRAHVGYINQNEGDDVDGESSPE